MGATRLQKSRQRVKVHQSLGFLLLLLGWGSWPSAATLGQPVLPLCLLLQLLRKEVGVCVPWSWCKEGSQASLVFPLLGGLGQRLLLGHGLLPATPFTGCHLLFLRIPRNGEGLECHRSPHCLLLQLASISRGSSPQGKGFPISWQVPTSLCPGGALARAPGAGCYTPLIFPLQDGAAGPQRECGLPARHLGTLGCPSMARCWEFVGRRLWSVSSPSYSDSVGLVLTVFL